MTKNSTSCSKNTRNKLDRREFIQKTSTVLSGVGLVGPYPFINFSRETADNLFTLGVASGDPLPDSVVLWTRLAPKPLEGGGMPPESVEVQWEMATDDTFTFILKNGTTLAVPEMAHAVHVEVFGLEPSRHYFYRFRVGDQISPVGRTKTAPPYGQDLEEMNFAFASCQNYQSGFYTAYDHMVKEDLDVVFFLGDYIYEGDGNNESRSHLPAKEITTLNEYRIRYGQYKSDPSLQAAHAAFPWIVTPDDHEVDNNWGGEGPPYENNEEFLARRSAAFQAYYEHLPLRKSAMPMNMNIQLFRRFNFGNLAEFSVLDTRQFRTNFACNDGWKADCDERLDPARTMLGMNQENWLFENLSRSYSRWNILAQQVQIAEVGREMESKIHYNMDKWSGYAATRQRLFDTIQSHNISNFVVLTGDSHKNWVNHLLTDFSDPNSQIIGTEFMGTSITSGGDGYEINDMGYKLMRENPHIKYYNGRRGYVRCRLTPEEMRTEFKLLPFISRPDAPIHTDATYVVKNGIAGAERV